MLSRLSSKQRSSSATQLSLTRTKTAVQYEATVLSAQASGAKLTELRQIARTARLRLTAGLLTVGLFIIYGAIVGLVYGLWKCELAMAFACLGCVPFGAVLVALPLLPVDIRTVRGMIPLCMALFSSMGLLVVAIAVLTVQLSVGCPCSIIDCRDGSSTCVLFVACLGTSACAQFSLTGVLRRALQRDGKVVCGLASWSSGICAAPPDSILAAQQAEFRAEHGPLCTKFMVHFPLGPGFFSSFWLAGHPAGFYDLSSRAALAHLWRVLRLLYLSQSVVLCCLLLGTLVLGTECTLADPPMLALLGCALSFLAIGAALPSPANRRMVMARLSQSHTGGPTRDIAHILTCCGPIPAPQPAALRTHAPWQDPSPR